MATVQGIYIALFGRPADPLGLQFYNGVTNNGQNLSGIQGLTGSAEYQARFAGQTNVQIVNSIYQSLFARDADLGGLTFYVGELQAGRLTIEQIAIAIYDGATGTDATILANKEVAANQFTASIDTGTEVIAYDADAIPAAQAYLAGVTADPATIPTQAETDALIAQIEAGVVTPGEIFTLTDGLDQIVGTAGNDTIQGVVADLGAFDSIDGAGGTDTLNLIGNASAIAAPGLSIQNVEVVNLVQNGTPGTFSAALFGNAQQIWQIDATADTTGITGLTGSQTAGFRDTAVGAVAYVAAATTAAVALDEVDNGGTLNVDGINLTSLTVSGSVVAAAGVTETLTITTTNEDPATPANDGSNIATVTISLTNAVELDISDLTETVTLNASGSAALDTDLSALVNLESATFGAGSDNVTAALAEVNVAIDLGAGNDTLSFTGTNASTNPADAVSATITLGAGNDSFTLAAGGNLSDTATTDAQIEASLITITDFTSGQDTLAVTGFTFANFDAQAGATGVDATISGSATLAEAIAALRADANDQSQFVLNGNLYIYLEDGTAGNDTLVELTGVTTLLTAADIA